MRRLWRRDAIDEMFDRFQKWYRRCDELEPDEVAFLEFVRGNRRQMAHAPLNGRSVALDCKVYRLNGFHGKRSARVEESAVWRDVDDAHRFADRKRSPAGAEDVESRMLPPVS